MAETKAAKKRTQAGLTAEDRVAMRETIRERKAGKTDESHLLAKIAEMPEADRKTAERLHALIKETAPALSPRTWYGMPAYSKEDKVLCFFQSAHKFKARYATLGFSDQASLDEGNMWPTSFALKKLTAADEATIRELLKRAVG